MTAGCPGPSAALLAVLSNHGVLSDITAAAPDTGIDRARPAGAVRSSGLFIPPDPPPPRG